MIFISSLAAEPRTRSPAECVQRGPPSAALILFKLFKGHRAETGGFSQRLRT